MIIKFQLSALANETGKNGQPLSIALSMLVRAYQYAEDIKVDRWEFAVPIEEFRYAGVTVSELRWLLFSGIAIHARAILGNQACSHRARLDIRSFPSDACFVLSDQGIDLLQVRMPILGQSKANKHHSNAIPRSVQSLRIAAGAEVDSQEDRAVPQWDASRRELTFRGFTVKTFRSTAPNQERILAAFEEEGWTRRVDDPLPPEAGQDSRERLRCAIKQLNRNQENKLVRFSGDGSGKGILWQLVV